jgi:hypothetical protein
MRRLWALLLSKVIMVVHGCDKSKQTAKPKPVGGVYELANGDFGFVTKNTGRYLFVELTLLFPDCLRESRKAARFISATDVVAKCWVRNRWRNCYFVYFKEAISLRQ